MNKIVKKIIIVSVLCGGFYNVAMPEQEPNVHHVKKHKKTNRKKRRVKKTGKQRVKKQNKPLTIQEKIVKIAHSIPGDIALSALHVESGQRYSFNEQTLMPMASVAKLAVALCCLQQVDDGRLSLDQTIAIRVHDLYQIDRADERQLLKKKVIYRPLRELIEQMMEVSDNPSTDIILRHIGGIDAVNAYLEKIGAIDIHMDRTILQLMCDYSGYHRPRDPYGCTNGEYRTLQANANKDAQVQAEMKFYRDQRDRATPAAITGLLLRLYNGELLSKTSTSFLLHCMGRLDHRGNRLGGALPDGATLMHKTGTMIGVTEYGIINDVGIITLPGGNGHLIVSVFINRSNASRQARPHVIARVARALCDECMTKV